MVLLPQNLQNMHSIVSKTLNSVLSRLATSPAGSSRDMTHYQYRTLEHSNSIRLLTLHPASSPASPIVCTIQHARLSDRPNYEAISYTWGEDTTTHSIYMDDGKSLLEVRSNCFNLLHHVRLLDRTRVLWIDAICIDQTNPRERGHQVRQMDQIYADASAVVVYLGEESSGSRNLFNELAEIDKELSRKKELSSIAEPIIYHRPTIVEELVKLIQRPWFRRVWILQEVCMNRSIFFMCGSAQATKGALITCMQGCAIKKNRFPEACRSHLVAQPNAQISLFTLLVRSRRFLATDLRDKVFALRSLMVHQQHRAAMDSLIDYTQSAAQAFLKTSLFLLPVIGLHLLTAIRHPHNMTMPSWIPDFSQTSPIRDLHWSFSVHESERIEEMFRRNMRDRRLFEVIYRPSMQLRMPLLQVLGMRFGKIRRTSSVFAFRDDEDSNNQMYALYASLPNMTSHLSRMGKPRSVGTPSNIDPEILAGE
jgi:hypothetical protein